MHTLTARLAALALLTFLVTSAVSEDDEPTEAAPIEEKMTQHAEGTFQVKMDLRTPSEGEPESIARMVLDKTYEGDLDATGGGQMLAFRSTVEGSAGYVAMERVEGALGGRSGSFVLQHSGLMTRGEPRLTLVVVPDSGSGELAGLTGSMKIIIADGQHSYEFDYELP